MQKITKCRKEVKENNKNAKRRKETFFLIKNQSVYNQ